MTLLRIPYALFTFALFAINLAWSGIVVSSMGLLKALLPPLENFLARRLELSYIAWARRNGAIINLTNNVEWKIEVDGELSKEHWYLMMSNHISWIDILAISYFTAGKVPMPRFFIKQELLYVPFLGLGAWSLDMPFMRRYSQAYLKKNPHLKGKDLETTRRSCEKFRHRPTSVLNFVEGTRYTDQKQQQTKSPYRHLLRPKAGGIAYTLGAMGELFNNILNITIIYPDNPGHKALDVLQGKMKRIVIKVEVQDLDEKVLGDYFNDSQFKRGFQQWLTQSWQRKDEQLDNYLGHKDNQESEPCLQHSNNG